MTEFKREIQVRPGYDRRDEGGGADGCDLTLILAGELGAITAGIDTGWMVRPLVGRMVRGSVQERRDAPGIDAGLVNCYPSTRGAYAHSPVRLPGFESERDACPWLGDRQCWYFGHMSADDVLKALVSGGSDAAFEVMAGLYKSWLVDRVAS